MRTRREPERTCVGCRATGSKRDLVRVVRAPDGTVVVDRSGRAPGRGAYVHRSARCFDLAVRRGAVSRALRSSLDRSETARLMEALRETAEEKR